MKKLPKIIVEGVSDALILSLLVIVPIAFLGPGWQTSSTYDKNGRFSKQHEHESLSGETGEDGQSLPSEPAHQSRKDRDIPILRAFEIERQAESSSKR